MTEPQQRAVLQSGGEADASDLVIDSVTGVDVALPIAGPGARAYGFIIDWMIRTILFIAWYVVAALLYNGRWSLSAPSNPEGSWFGMVVAPGAAIYFLYHYVLEVAMHGRTPGKRLAGVRLVTRDGAPPTLGQHLTRNVFRLIDSFPLFYGVGLVTTLLTRDQVRVGDLAAGTLLVYDRVELVSFEETKSAGKVDPATVEIIHELLGRWSSLNEAARRRLAGRLLGTGADALSDQELRDNLGRMARGDRNDRDRT
jgi:uncharacterized RDD family membrane protein YckC